IRTLLSAENFRKGTDLYFERHDGQAVTTEDFVKAMEDANGVDLTQFRRWYSQAGTPTLKVSSDYDEAAATYTLTINQSCPPTPGQPEKLPNHMPVAVGLLDASGNDMPLNIDSGSVAHIHTEGEAATAILDLREAEQRFVFECVTSKPVPSILRGFSAPVKLDYAYSRDELMFLMSHDSDGFNRWEASQQLAVDVIREMVSSIQAGETPSVDERLLQAFQANLDEAVSRNMDPEFDKAMVADMMLLPAETYLAELYETADVDAIHQAREAIRGAVAKYSAGSLLAVYKLNQSSEAFAATGQQIARRSLKNVALSYMMQPDDTEVVKLCVDQFKSANCMSDTSTALRCLINSNAPDAAEARETCLTEFYNRWSDEALVVDLWFNMQAGSTREGTLERVKALMSHEAFTIRNPNRLRSLVVPFAFQNCVRFHDKSGAGYEFLADRVIELHSLNPQLAARILSPLTRWKKYDETRQGLMRAQLQRILDTEDLSRDVYEIAFKSA
ncbi:MAG: DUF3458 domain-containing protein, partial [Pseudomonadales bacterium]|nr:DUF3458 domain-containing protein [Pseudomonadales bacterium]